MAKYMGFAFHHSLAVYTMLASPFVALIVIVSAIVFRRKDSRFRIGLPIAILAASALLCMAVIAADPGRFIFWFTD